jgi:hypothetical protein
MAKAKPRPTSAGARRESRSSETVPAAAVRKPPVSRPLRRHPLLLIATSLLLLAWGLFLVYVAYLA